MNAPVPTGSALPHFSERARPGALLLGGGILFTLSIAIAYAAMLGPLSGLLALAVATTLFAALVAMSSWRISASPQGLRVRSTTVPLTDITGAESLDINQARALAGPEADARALLALKSGLPAVKVSLVGAYPYWLISSRRPDELATTINALISPESDHPVRPAD